MTEPNDALPLSPLKQALRALDSMQERLRLLEHSRREPIAIIGMGCRFPGGADSPEALWSCFAEGRDGVTEVPKDRWDVNQYYDARPSTPGRTNVRWGSFIDRADQFDPLFFGISPREAASTDPQQRLLLEVTYEALERAGLTPSRIAGSRTGVFVGLCNHDYMQYLVRNPQGADTYSSTGIAAGLAAGRISYLLDLHGPALSIDTTCSSSAAAIHQACLSLRAGESDLALAAGVNLMLSPLSFVLMSPVQVLSPDGRCKTFDARANGYVRGEGCGVVVLKRLSDATADSDDIVAVIHGSAMNHDGRSNGLSAPNVNAQRAVIQMALADAGIHTSDVNYVEAHGTGTPLGDPIEIEAIRQTYGAASTDAHTCLVGAAKTNFGHLEGAAGILGLIKAALVVEQGSVPPNLHFETLNPRITLEGSCLAIPTKLTTWPGSQERQRLAGVSSFGLSGTNVHLVVGQAPPKAPPQKQEASAQPHIITVSAHSPASLERSAIRLADHLTDRPDLSIEAVALTSHLAREHHPLRIAVVANSTAQASEKLRAGRARGRSSRNERAPRVGFLFAGQGAQYAGMGMGVRAWRPEFREAFDQATSLCCDVLDQPFESLFSATEPSPLHSTKYTQVALFALEYALAQVWLSWGVRPAIVMGHSVGEYVAACVAGVYSFEDGLRLVAERGRLMSELLPGGSMVAVFASLEVVSQAAVAGGAGVSIAAVNGPAEVVIAGATDAVQLAVARLKSMGVRTKPLAVSQAFHSPLVESVLDPLERAAAKVAMTAPSIPIVSNVTGRLESTLLARADYWRDHSRARVEFFKGLTAMQQQGCDLFLEIGPGAQLTALGQAALPEAPFIPSLRKGRDDRQQMLAALGELYERGLDIEWSKFHGKEPGARVQLPTYPFDRRRHWAAEYEPMRLQDDFTRQGPGQDAAAGHPLLGSRLPFALGDHVVFQTWLHRESLPHLADHRVFGEVVLPAAAYLEMLRAAVAQVLLVEKICLRQVAFHLPLSLSEVPVCVQTVVERLGEGRTAVRILSRRGEGAIDAWTLHVSAAAAANVDAPEIEGVDVDRVAELPSFEVSDFYRTLLTAGVELGPGFQTMRTVGVGDGQAVGVVETLTTAAPGAWFDPAQLDGCFQVAGVASTVEIDGSNGRDSFLPSGVDEFELHCRPSTSCLCVGRMRPGPVGAAELIFDLNIHDAASGKAIAAIRGLRCRRLEAVRGESFRGMDWLYDIDWLAQERPEGATQTAGVQLSSTEIARRITDQALAERSHGQFQGFDLELERLAFEYVAAAFRDLGWEALADQTHSIETLRGVLGVVPAYARLFRRLVDILSEEGRASVHDDSVRLSSLKDVPGPAARHAAMRDRFPDCDAELQLVSLCGAALAEVTAGRRDPLEVLFPGGSLGLIERMYQHSPLIRSGHEAVAAAVAAAAAGVDANSNGTRRPVRVLEIGGGTGATTAFVLEALGNVAVEYWFTDVSRMFLTHAQTKFRDRQDLRFLVLDIERRPRDQGFHNGYFDVVIAANVLHATRDLRQSLAHVREVMAPHAALVLLEGTRPERAADITLGLTNGWWRFEDTDLRPHHPLLAGDGWPVLLREQGFEAPVIAERPQDGSGAEAVTQQAIIVAKKPASAADTIDTDGGGPWLLFGGDSPVARSLADVLRAAGASVLLVRRGRTFTRGVDGFEIAGDEDQHFEQLFAQPEVTRCRGVVHLWGLDHSQDEPTVAAVAEAQRDGLGSVLRIVQCLARIAHSPPKLWVVTAGSQVVPSGPPKSGLTVCQAPLWGLGRVIAQEHPELWGGLVDLALPVKAADMEQVAAEVLQADGEDHIAFREGHRFVARLARVPFTKSADPFIASPNATYLVAGAFGGLGMEVVAWLVAQGARHLALLGRSAPSTEASAVLADLERRGVAIQILEADLADAARMTEVLARCRATMPPLRGVVHCAGALSDGALISQTWESFEKVLGPKVNGSWSLHELTREDELDLFVLFSSAASLVGSPGQANHAAANAFEDALAHHRRALGLPALSINWAGWSGVGAAVKNNLVDSMAGRGLEAIPPDVGMEIFGRLVGQDRAQVGVLPVRWDVWRRTLTGRVPPLFSVVTGETEAVSRRERGESRNENELWLRLSQTTDDAGKEQLLSGYLTSEVARVLMLDSEQLDAGTPLNELGMDSLMAIQLKNRMELDLQMQVPVVAFLEGLSIRQLARRLLALKAGDGRKPAAMPSVSSSMTVDSPQASALLASVERLGDADVDSLLTELLAGEDPPASGNS